jgi:hypothetical protein
MAWPRRHMIVLESPTFAQTRCVPWIMTKVAVLPSCHLCSCEMCWRRLDTGQVPLSLGFRVRHWAGTIKLRVKGSGFRESESKPTFASLTNTPSSCLTTFVIVLSKRATLLNSMPLIPASSDATSLSLSICAHKIQQSAESHTCCR